VVVTVLMRQAWSNCCRPMQGHALSLTNRQRKRVPLCRGEAAKGDGHLPARADGGVSTGVAITVGDRTASERPDQAKYGYDPGDSCPGYPITHPDSSRHLGVQNCGPKYDRARLCRPPLSPGCSGGWGTAPGRPPRVVHGDDRCRPFSGRTRPWLLWGQQRVLYSHRHLLSRVLTRPRPRYLTAVAWSRPATPRGVPGGR